MNQRRGDKRWRVFCLAYGQWVTNPKLLVFFGFLVLMRKLVILPIRSAASMMDQPLNLWEVCIALGNSEVILLFLPIFYIVMVSDCPKLGQDLYYLIPRAGRMDWFMGQVVFMAAAAFGYLLVIVLVALVQVANIAYAVNAWSLVTTDFDTSPYAGMGISMNCLIPMNLHYQMPPLQAFLYTYLLQFFYLLLWNSFILLGFAYGRKSLAFFSALIIVAAGMGLVAVKSPYMWLMPSSHAILWIHCSKYYREFLFWPMASLLLLFLASVVLTVLAARQFGRVNLDSWHGQG
ncbi:MAG: hypothetical protein K2K70_06070 [Lachnospiraceae bacterium]|nr:hypothetical protein [Lachnospiraceae bacterium]